jgi:hypothetical protein
MLLIFSGISFHDLTWAYSILLHIGFHSCMISRLYKYFIFNSQFDETLAIFLVKYHRLNKNCSV